MLSVEALCAHGSSKVTNVTADTRSMAACTREHGCESYGIRNNIDVAKCRMRMFRGHDMINGTIRSGKYEVLRLQITTFTQPVTHRVVPVIRDRTRKTQDTTPT